MMIEHYFKVNILGQVVELFRDQTAYGYFCVAVMDDKYYQLGDQPATLETALAFWEKERRSLSPEEMVWILEVNGLKRLLPQ